MKTDKEGYILLENEFSERGFDFKFVKDLDGGWKIYKRTNKRTLNVKYELIKPKRQESYQIHGNTIPAKWSYPGDSSFGRTGFDCISLDVAIQRHHEIMSNKESHSESAPVEIKFPKKEFTIKDLLTTNKQPYSKIYLKVKEFLNTGQIKKVGQKKNKRGKSSDIYQIA